MTRIVVAISGATGAIYGIKLLQEFNKAAIETQLIISNSAQKTIELETDYLLDDIGKMASHQFSNSDIAAPPASGSFLHQGMVIAPCSMKTLSAIANGYADNLINRAADVVIKERRKLVLLVRETPLSPIHLENMLKLSRLGVIIMPPVPSFYHRPRTIEDIIKQMIGRIFDQLGIENSLLNRWPIK
ncbi:UbiX family flavin prenyltransferase [Pelotomaculum terephthalicicum JT]|uniref:UbiX family flavin prenyltransferase n=1 Tax=Pelotomaculum terephthalicicum TaxID=206393 RepID=UPI0009C44EE0|nr:UbiX family flavin prenyltransferase [Pelotomaculum terephthalicicum]MCG9966535.1 UbiX family flavin prenyltransferase [Pelotomaculum terephthalicicum JT]OPY62819.1 MAG: Phenolic acid decarboxylase subunit B [Pelotomaculum sp. PtaU1.Bin065]